MTSPIETNNVVERLIEAALILRAKGYSEHADAADQAASTAQSLSDRIDELEGERERLREDAEVGRKLRLGKLPFQQPTGVPGQ